MSLTTVKVASLVDYLEACEAHKAAPQIFGLFCGGTDPATGESWCPDCVVGTTSIYFYNYEKSDPRFQY